MEVHNTSCYTPATYISAAKGMALNWNSRKTRDRGNGEFLIPPSMHFLWGFLGDGGTLPPRETGNLTAWQHLNQNWQHHVQSPEVVERLLTPDVAPLYQALPTAIQRCDLARPILLHQMGGVYSDLDVQPFRDLNWLCGLYPRARVLLVEEVTLSKASARRRGNRFSIRAGRPELRLRVANFWMASAPGHPFWLDVLELIHERSVLPVTHDYDVIYTTGPDIISEVYDRTIDKYDDVALVPRRVARRFFRHRTHGSWRTQGNARNWAA